MFKRSELIIGLILLLATAGAVWWFIGVITENNQLNTEVKQLREDKASQALTIEELERNEETNRKAISQQLINEQHLRDEHDELFEKYKSALNNNTCANQLIPDPIVKLLQQ